MTRFGPVSEPQPMHLQVTEALRTAILRGNLRVGERLPLEEIGKEFGVSRMPVREALIRLEKEGLIVFHNRRGAEVAGITAEQMRDITDLRCLLEVDALRRAARRIAPADLAAARAILREARTVSGIDDLADLHWRFHHALYAPCHRPLQMELIDSLHLNVDRFFRAEWRQVGLRKNWIEDHEQIVAALEAGDTETAVRTIDDHIQAASERVIATLG